MSVDKAARAVRVGVAGYGTVGSGVCRVLRRNASVIAGRAGRELSVARVVCRHPEKVRAELGPEVEASADWRDIVNDPRVDIAVELMGGTGAARDFIMAALAAGKHVVTANKALLAERGNEIFAAAAERGLMVAFEAAVAGGIPIIKTLREGLAANRVEWVAGIINGTSNFILTAMRERGLTFAAALAEAQRAGYAEADPSFDIEGVDAAHKLALISSLAFGVPINLAAVHVEGINGLAQEDIVASEAFGYRVKLLGIARRTAGGIEQRVHPTLVPKRRLIANVEGVMNAVLVKCDATAATLYYGPGAGGEPTASAVIADLLDVSRLLDADSGSQAPALGFAASDQQARWLDMDDIISSYYLRLRVADRPGVLAEVARIFADNEISIETLSQREAAHGAEDTDIVLLTHSAREGNVRRAISAIEGLASVNGPVVMIRKEALK